jgi:hypothetical protein
MFAIYRSSKPGLMLSRPSEENCGLQLSRNHLVSLSVKIYLTHLPCNFTGWHFNSGLSRGTSYKEGGLEKNGEILKSTSSVTNTQDDALMVFYPLPSVYCWRTMTDFCASNRKRRS